MLKKAIEMRIRLKMTNGLREKVDTLYALGSLTDEEYLGYVEQLEATTTGDA